MVSPAQIDPAVDYTFDSVVVSVAVGSDERVSLVLICDPRFVSPDGISPGMTVDDLKSAKISDGMQMPGWYYLIPLIERLVWCIAIP